MGFLDGFNSTSESWAGASLSYEAYSLIQRRTGINIDKLGWKLGGFVSNRANELYRELVGGSLKNCHFTTYAVLTLLALNEAAKSEGSAALAESSRIGVVDIVADSLSNEWGEEGKVPRTLAIAISKRL